MRIGRISSASSSDFAIQNKDGGWVTFASLGIDAPDTASAIEQYRIALARFADGRGQPVRENLRLQCPIVRPAKVLAIGLNYMDHIRETGAQQPERPVVFAKYSNALSGPSDPIEVDPALTEQADYESELAVIIGKRVRRLDVSEALSAVFGYAVANDVSARDWQRRDAQFSRSKSYDTFCPVGPWITTADEIPNPNSLNISSTVNGEIRQRSNTREMIFSVAYLVSFLSQSMTLEPGDLLLTGTPHGVGFAMSPPRFLQPGDRVECEVEGLGSISNQVVIPSC